MSAPERENGLGGSKKLSLPAEVEKGHGRQKKKKERFARKPGNESFGKNLRPEEGGREFQYSRCPGAGEKCGGGREKEYFTILPSRGGIFTKNGGKERSHCARRWTVQRRTAFLAEGSFTFPSPTEGEARPPITPAGKGRERGGEGWEKKKKTSISPH